MEDELQTILNECNRGLNTDDARKTIQELMGKILETELSIVDGQKIASTIAIYCKMIRDTETHNINLQRWAEMRANASNINSETASDQNSRAESIQKLSDFFSKVSENFKDVENALKDTD